MNRETYRISSILEKLGGTLSTVGTRVIIGLRSASPSHFAKEEPGTQLLIPLVRVCLNCSRAFESGEMRCVCGDNPAQNAASNHVADKMIIHCHKAHEHRSAENDHDDLYGSTARHPNQPHRGEAQDSTGVT